MPRKLNVVKTAEKLKAFESTLEHLIETSRYGLSKFEITLDNPKYPRARVELAMPDTNPMTIVAEVRYGESSWHVEASGWSWKCGDPDKLRSTAEQLALAASIVHGLNRVASYEGSV